MDRKRGRRILVAVAAVVVVAGVAFGTYQATNGGSSSPGPGPNRPASQVQLISVSGNQLMQNGKPVRLIGVNLGDSSYYCLGDKPKPFAIPADSASISAIVSWHVNAVRILVVQDCWLGLDGEPHATTSANYQKSIESFVSMLNSAHIEVILGLAAFLPLTYRPNGSREKASALKMADPDSEALWTSVATAFRSYPAVMFDLFSEPEQIPWPCWENGCTIGRQQYVGMQQLVDAVRQTGARQPLLLGGVDYANNLSEWLAYEPTDPLHELVASAHIYSSTPCNNATCWNSELARTSQHVPVVTGEFGATSCSTDFVKRYMKWADKHGISYLAWAWIPGACSFDGPLISSYSGVPSTYGSVFQRHLVALYNAGSGNVGSISAGSAVAKSESKKKKK